MLHIEHGAAAGYFTSWLVTVGEIMPAMGPSFFFFTIYHNLIRHGTQPGDVQDVLFFVLFSLDRRRLPHPANQS